MTPNIIKFPSNTTIISPAYSAIFKEALVAAELLAAFIFPKLNFTESRRLLPRVLVKEYCE